MRTHNQTAMIEAHRNGLRAAGDSMPRDKANETARALPTEQGDAFLAGYYAELRRLARR